MCHCAVLTKVRQRTAAKKKETTMSQMTSFWKAVKACWKLRVFVKMVTVIERNAQAPVGKGSKTSPAAIQIFQSAEARCTARFQAKCTMITRRRADLEPSSKGGIVTIWHQVNVR